MALLWACITRHSIGGGRIRSVRDNHQCACRRPSHPPTPALLTGLAAAPDSPEQASESKPTSSSSSAGPSQQQQPRWQPKLSEEGMARARDNNDRYLIPALVRAPLVCQQLHAIDALSVQRHAAPCMQLLFGRGGVLLHPPAAQQVQ